jgi:tellurite resistance protein TerC
MTHTAVLWSVLALAAAAAFSIDQRLHRDGVSPSLKRSAIETAIWTVVGLAFTGVVWGLAGSGGAVEYVTGYTLEKSLSLDNVAVFAVIVVSLQIPANRQRRLIDHAILAALALRLAFIGGGLALLDHVHPVLYLFGAILVISGVRMFTSQHRDDDTEPPRMVAVARRLLPLADGDHGQKYVVRTIRRRRATLLFVALVALALVDVVFAVDSVPAIFSVTHDAWIVSAANAFALLGMRPMYFLLAESMNRLVYLQRGLAVILTGIGVDLLIEDHFRLPTVATLGFVVAVLAVSIAASLRKGAVTPANDVHVTHDEDRRTEVEAYQS